MANEVAANFRNVSYSETSEISKKEALPGEIKGSKVAGKKAGTGFNLENIFVC